MNASFLSSVLLATAMGATALAATAEKPAEQAPAKKRLVVCTVTFGFRHSCIPIAEAALADMDAKSDDIEIVEWLRQPENKADGKASLAKLDPQWLRENKIDGVIFCNTTGDLPLPDPEGLVKWVEEGHAFIGMHAATDTLKNFSPYIQLVGGCFQGHGPQVDALLHACDKDHAVNAGIGDTWQLKKEEIYHIKDQNRDAVHLVWAMRNDPNDKAKTGTYPIAWCSEAQKGRVFYTALGHREDLWSLDPAQKDRVNPVETAEQFRAHVMAGIRWALGTAKGDAKPNPEWK
ncbi:MAG: ThuA domain-containing protein [Kiritimatiellia bacterium]